MTLMLGKIECREGGIENEMVGWHTTHGHEFEPTPEDSERHREAWRAAVQWVTKSWRRLSD